MTWSFCRIFLSPKASPSNCLTCWEASIWKTFLIPSDTKIYVQILSKIRQSKNKLNRFYLTTPSNTHNWLLLQQSSIIIFSKKSIVSEFPQKKKKTLWTRLLYFKLYHIKNRPPYLIHLSTNNSPIWPKKHSISTYYIHVALNSSTRITNWLMLI